MRRRLPLMLLCLLAVLPALSRAASSRPPFDIWAQRALTQLIAADPSHATQIGAHQYDRMVTDYSAAARARDLSQTRRLLAELHRFNLHMLTPDQQVDAALLDNRLQEKIWTKTQLRDWAWDTQIYNDAVGAALYSLAARDFAPWATRLRAATARMHAIPTLLAQARANLDPARVPPVFATALARQNPGLVEIATTMLAPHRNALSAVERQRFDAAVLTLKSAVATHQHWIDTVLVPNARGDFRLGPALYDQKLRFAIGPGLDRATLKARALAAVADTRREMYAIARTVLSQRADIALPDQPSDQQQQHAIEAALELTYAHHPARDALEHEARLAVARTSAFVRTKALITLLPGPVRIIEMPTYQQGVAVAYCDAPGPLEPKLPTFFAVSPIPASWSDAQASSFLREYNDYMVQDLSIHEAMPGHYVQLAHANATPDPIRAVLGSGPFVEGWAVYAEGMMADTGYMAGDPLFKLTVLKMRLRSITNTLLDIGIHAEGMSEAEAMRMMTQTAFQQEREAVGKWTRARLSSTQLLSYFVGYTEHLALREEAERRWGRAFTLARYHEAVLAHGEPPARFVRALMFHLPVDAAR